MLDILNNTKYVNGIVYREIKVLIIQAALEKLKRVSYAFEGVEKKTRLFLSCE